MVRLLDRLLNRSANLPCGQFSDAKHLIEGLRQEENAAIRCLSAKIARQVYRIGRTRGLTDEDIEELHCDCIYLLIEKIRTEKFEYRGNEPSTYAIEIAKRRVYHYVRLTAKHRTAELTTGMDSADEPGYGSQEQVELLSKLLYQLDENCRNLIQLKYLEGLKDKEVIEQKRTQYTTENAVKTHRYNCMKKLAELAHEWEKALKKD